MGIFSPTRTIQEATFLRYYPNQKEIAPLEAIIELK
jgi:hypothetical protein